MKALALLCGVIFSITSVGIALPYGFPLVSPLFLITVLTFIFLVGVLRLNFRINLEFLIFYAAFLFFFLIGGLNSFKVYNYFKQDFQNFIAIFAMFIVLSLVYQQGLFPKFETFFLKVNGFLALLIGLLSCYKIYMLSNGVILSWVSQSEGRYPWGTSLVGDYNVYSLGMLVGSVSLWFLARDTKSIFLKRSFIFCSLFVFSVSVLSGSRRALVVGLLVGLFFLFKFIKFLYKKSFLLLNIKRMAYIFSFLFIFGATSFYALEADIGSSLTGYNSRSMNDKQIDRIFNRYYNFFVFFERTLENSRAKLFRESLDIVEQEDASLIFFGDGFNYLAQLSTIHSKEKYPHNPFLSALLYGGILNLLLLTLFVCRIIYFYYIRDQFFDLWSILTFIGIVFILFSGNSIFSSKALCMFLVIPFIKDINFQKKLV